jgi:hypothetical protein
MLVEACIWQYLTFTDFAPSSQFSNSLTDTKDFSRKTRTGRRLSLLFVGGQSHAIAVLLSRHLSVCFDGQLDGCAHRLILSPGGSVPCKDNHRQC